MLLCKISTQGYIRFLTHQFLLLILRLTLNFHTLHGMIRLFILSNLKLKEYYRKKWKATSCLNYYRQFDRLRALSKHLISTRHAEYLSRVENSLVSNPSNLWKYVNMKKGTSRIPGKLSYDGTPYSSPETIVNAFAKKFSATFPVNSSNMVPDKVFSNNFSFAMSPVSVNDLVEVMTKFKNNFTAGDDLIPSFLVRDARHVFAKPLKIIINLSVKSSVFPDAWKRARITPVFKKGDYSMIENYRLISILSNFAKVFEQIIYKTIFYNVKPYISPYQHGFLPGRSTTSNLVTLVQYICKELDDHGQIDVIHTDFSSAFDCINHKFLLLKLRDFGFSLVFQGL